MSQFQVNLSIFPTRFEYYPQTFPDGITFNFAESFGLQLTAISTNDSNFPPSEIQYSLDVTPKIGVPAGVGNEVTYTVKIAYIDPYTGDGLLSSSTATYTVAIIEEPPEQDTEPPTISLTGTSNYTFYRSTFTNTVPANEITFLINSSTSISDNSGIVSRFIFPTVTDWSPTSWPSTRSYNVEARDGSGNSSIDFVTISFSYIDDVLASADETPPTLLLSQAIFNYYVSDYPSGVSSTVITNDVNAKITASDDSGTVFINFSPTIQSITTIPSVGNSVSVNYSVSASDPSNNVSDVSTFTVNFINDTAPPSDTTPPEIIGDNVVTFNVDEQRDVNYLLSLYTLFDNSGVVGWYEMTNFIWGTVGTFSFTLKAIDGAGLITTRSITVNVLASLTQTDTTPPTITGSLSVTVYTSQALTEEQFINTYFVISDAGGVKTKNLSSIINFSIPGVYSTAIFASDNAGNVARFPANNTQFITITIIEGEQPGTPQFGEGLVFENIYIGNELVTNKVKIGFTFNDKIDVELDSATIVMPYTTKQEPYKPFTLVKFYFKDVEQPITYYISDDSVTRVSASQNFFEHSIVLIEPTKILERFKCVDMTFTQPIDNSFAPYTLLDVINRITYNNPPKKVSETTSHWDVLDSTLTNLLASIKAPQLQFRSMTIREVLDRTFQYINAVARLKILDDGTRVLSADFFNTQDTLIDLQNSINISRSQGSEFFAENSELTVENATTEYASVKFPSYGWAGVRSSSSLVDSNNIHIEVPFPIYEILSIKLFARVRAFRGLAGDNKYIETDITPYVLEKQLYDGLPIGTLTLQNNKEKHTFNNLYFTRGDNKIYNIAPIADLSPLGFANNSRVIDLIFDTIWGGEDFGAAWFPEKFSDLLFRIEYRTLLSSRLRFMRDVKEDFFGTIHTNQMENIVDLEGLGANARGVINRVGNPDLTATKISKNWEQRFKVGQFTQDGFIATDVENAVFNDHIRSTASFTKDYNGLSKFVGVDTEVRQLSIPLQTTKSLVHYDQFTIIDTQPIASIGSHFAQNLLLNEFSDYLKQIDDKTFTDNLNASATLYNFGSLFTIPDNFGIIEVLLNGTIVSGSSTANIFITPIIEDFVGAIPPIYTNSSTGTTFTNTPISVVLEPGKTYQLLLQRTTVDASQITLTIRYLTPYSFDKYMVKFVSYTDLGEQISKVAVAPDISAINNSIKLDFYFNDNLSAGIRVDRNITGAGQLLAAQYNVLYTDKIGRFGLYQFSLAKMVTPTTDEAKISVAERMPSALDSDFYDSILVSPIMKHKKDTTENFGLTYQSHFLVGDNSQGHIVIGKKFLTKWFKSDNLNDITFKLYVSTSATYNKFENEKAKGTMLSSNDAYTITTLTSTQQIRIDILADVSNAKSFAIGTANGDLVLGFNITHPITGAIKDMTTIFLNFTDKRS
jgi:hypothetical protein